MAKRSMAAVVQKVEDAEKIIQSYAYGADLDRAIKYLQDHDPENAVLATIKDFENDRPMLKALNALYRADKARDENDRAELEKIAKFLSLSENKELRSEAINIMRNLPENPIDDDKAESINTMLDVVKDGAEKKDANEKANKKSEAKEDAPQSEKKEMSDDEIFANAKEIDGIVDDKEFKQHIWDNAVVEAKKQVTVIDENGAEVDEENADKLWTAKMYATLHEATMEGMDNADFASKEREEKIAVLKKRALDLFWTELSSMAGASVVDVNKSDEENDAKVGSVISDFLDGKHVSVKTDQFVNNVVSTKRKMDEKAANLAKNGKNKSGSWLKRASQKFGKFIKEYVGTPAEVKQAAIGYFSSARGITNTAATLGFIGASMISMPVALGAAVSYGLYHAVSAPQWNILEKRNANLKLAKARGDAKEIKIWEGRAGLKHAYNAIQASPKEKTRFDRLKRINLRAGLGSAAIVAAATPFVLAGGLPALGIGAAAAWGATRLAASTARVAGANTNAYLQMKEAIRQDKEDQTAESRKGANRAKGAFWIGLVASGLAEYWMASSVADAAAQDHSLGDMTNTGENGGAEHSGAENGANGGNADAPTTEPTAVVVPEEWNANMGITEAQWNEMHDKFTGIFKNRADIFGMDNKAPNLTWQNMYQNIENAREAGALPNNLTDEQIMYKYMKLVENTERAEVVPGTKYLRSMLDADKQPMYYVDQEQMRALNDIILCGKEVNVSAEALGKSLARITDNGVYVGEGAGIGVTHNRFVGFGRGEDCPDGEVNAWERVKGAVRRVMKTDKVVEQEVVEEKTVVDAVVHEEAVVTEKPVVDKQVDNHVEVVDKTPQDKVVDDGALVQTKAQLGKRTSYDSSYGLDDKSLNHSRDFGTRVVPGSAVNVGREVGGR